MCVPPLCGLYGCPGASAAPPLYMTSRNRQSPENCREACQLCEHAYYQHTSTPAEVNALLDPLYAKCGIDGICGGMVFVRALYLRNDA